MYILSIVDNWLFVTFNYTQSTPLMITLKGTFRMAVSIFGYITPIRTPKLEYVYPS